VASILYITHGRPSRLLSSFGLSQRLVEGGHRVAYASPAAIAEEVQAQGYPFYPLRRDQQLAACSRADPMPPLWQPRALAAWSSRARERRRRSIADRELEVLVERLAPDLLLIDIEMHAAIIVTDAFRLPTLLPIGWFTIYRHPGLPPLHTRLRPGASRWVIEFAWLRLRAASALLRLRSRLWLPRFWQPIAWGTLNIGDLGALARSRGYRLRQRTDRRQWLRPHLYRDTPVLSFNVREMDLPHEPHPDLRYIGPMIAEVRRETRLEPPQQAAWQAFLQERAGRSEKRPLIYCSLGTYWSADRAFLRRVLAVFERRTDWRLALGLGGKLAPEELAPAPGNALLLPWAPQLEVLAVADCAITHGGITTINECIAHGVPMVVYSTHHVDQDGCAVRVAHHGLGVIGEKDRDDVDAIERKIERVLEDPAIRSRVAAMRRTFEDYGARDVALRVIEQALEAGRQRPARGGA
jgi:UDP:flavonoid glycosyltransferase YjiC (YdhE family)